jgi:chondroitin 4-sulfotransferase 11
MLYSRARGFLFIHIQKTGGTSVTEALAPLVPDATQHEMAKDVHASALWVRETIGAEAFANLYRFAFVRNPYDRLLSWYSMIQQLPLDNLTNLQRTVRVNCPTFESFVLHGPDVVRPEFAAAFRRTQLSYIADRQGRVLMDLVGRFERFAEDVHAAFQRIGVEAALPHVNPSRHVHYRDAYSLRMRAAVRFRFRQDFDAFGYRF